ncbi:MAG: hypothetical protein AB8B57_08190 [Congregibacter sp.]
MRLNFLCRHHRRSLLASPRDARSVWQDYYPRITKSPCTPTPYQVNLAGTALEAATIYLLAEPVCAGEDLECFTETALLLIGMLEQLGESGLATTVVSGAGDMLQQFALRGANTSVALAQSRKLHSLCDPVAAGGDARADSATDSRVLAAGRTSVRVH